MSAQRVLTDAPAEDDVRSFPLPVPTVERDLETARELIRNVVAAFREGDEVTQRSVLQQASRTITQLALNAGRRGKLS